MKILTAILTLVCPFFITLAGAQTDTGVSTVLYQTVELTNQTAAIPLTTLFTPKVSGVYRVSMYIELTQLTSVQVTACPHLQWTDESMTTQINSIPVAAWGYAGLYCAGNYPAQNENVSASGVTVIRAVVGTPVTYSVGYGALPGAPPFSLFVTVERLSTARGSH